MDHVIDPRARLASVLRQVGEPQGAVVVVELERRDPRRVGLERQHHDVAHQPHVLGAVLRDPSGRPLPARLLQRRSPAQQLVPPAGAGDP